MLEPTGALEPADPTRARQEGDLLRDSLARIRRRVLAERVLGIASLDLLWALSAYAGYLFIARALSLWERPLPGLLVALCAALLSTVVRSVLGARVSRFEAAVLCDDRLRLKERVSSAVHAEAHPGALPGPEWGELIRRDGERCLAGVDIRKSFPVRMPALARWTLLPAALAVLIAFLPPLDILGLGRKRQVEAAMLREVERKRNELEQAIQKLREEAEKPPDPEVQKALDALARRPEGTEVKKKEDAPPPPADEAKKDAMVKLARLEEALKKELDRSGLDALKQFLDRFPPGSMARSPLTGALRDALKQGEFGKALSELKKLKDQLSALDAKKQAGQLSQEDLEKLKKLSEELARLGKDSALLSKLSSGLAGAAGDLAAGDLSSALENLMGLDKELGDLGKTLKDLQFLEGALELAQLSLDELGKLHKCPNCGKVSQNPGGT